MKCAEGIKQNIHDKKSLETSWMPLWQLLFFWGLFCQKGSDINKKTNK